MSSLQQLFKIELPIIQAPMASVQAGALAIAVSNAGGLGSLPCALLDTEAMARELAAIASRTQRPYNVNFFCHAPTPFDAERDARWRSALAPYYREFGIDSASIGAGTDRAPFSADSALMLERFRPPVVSFNFGLPDGGLLARVRAIGARILGTATTVAEARWLESRGVDAIVAQGYQAGGHRGSFLSNDLTTQVGTFALLPQIVAAVNVPVIAAGGIADSRGVAAALALGAAGARASGRPGRPSGSRAR
jgi:nitronate monooxygenase